jgi:hypothetical protein
MLDVLEAENEKEDDYIFIYEFSHAFYSTTDPGTRLVILEDFCNRVISRQRDLGGDAAALLTVCQHYDTRQRSNIDLERLKLIATEPEGKQRAKVLTQKAGYYSAQRKRRALKKLIALWSYHQIEHYQWELLSWSTLEKLAKIASNLPEWDKFVDIANCCMILRHEASVGKSATRAIGEHAGRTDHSRGEDSPLEPADIEKISIKLLGHQPKHKRKATCDFGQADTSWLRKRIQQWLNPCTCLSVRGKTIGPTEFRRYAVELDSFGMLVHSHESRQRSCKCSKYDPKRTWPYPTLPTYLDREDTSSCPQRLLGLNSHIEAGAIPNGQLMTARHNSITFEPKKRLSFACNHSSIRTPMFDTGGTNEPISAMNCSYAGEIAQDGSRNHNGSEINTIAIHNSEGFEQNQSIDQALPFQRSQFGGLRLPVPIVTQSVVPLSVSGDVAGKRAKGEASLSEKEPEHHTSSSQSPSPSQNIFSNQSPSQTISSSQSPSLWTKQTWTSNQWKMALDDRNKVASMEMFYNESEEPCSEILLTLINHYRRQERLQDNEEVELLALSLPFNIWVSGMEVSQRFMKLGSWFQLPPLRPFGERASAWYGGEVISNLVHMYTAHRCANATYFLDCERYCWLLRLSTSELGWLANPESPMSPALQRKRSHMPHIPQHTSRVVIAFNIQNSHWISVSVDLPEDSSAQGESEGTIAVYDSLSSTGICTVQPRLQALADLLASLSDLKRRVDSWKILQKPCLQQMNNYDCGPITVNVCVQLLSRKPVSISPIDGDGLRGRFIADLFAVFHASQADLTYVPQNGKSPIYNHTSPGAVDALVCEELSGLWDSDHSPADDFGFGFGIPENLAEQIMPPPTAASETKENTAKSQSDDSFGAIPSSVKHDCSICKETCRLCIVPTSYGKKKADEMYKTAHDVADMTAAKIASPSALMLPIQFANVHELTEHDLIEPSQSALQADAWSMPATLLWKLAETTVRLSRPLIIRETFSDGGNYSPQQISQLLEGRYGEKKIRVVIENKLQPQDMAVEALTAELRSHLDISSQTPLKVSSLGDIAKANKPSFTRLYRFTQLERLVDRWKLGKVGIAQKQIHLTAFDVASCLNFNLLSTRGAFSGPYRDASGGKWLRNLFGKILWWVVPPHEMTSHEEEKFAREGSAWNPRGKIRALIQEQDDVLILPHDPGIIHASMTLENALLDGGLFWDDRHLVELLEFMLVGLKNPATTNEPAAFQMPELVQELESYPGCQEDLQRLMPIILELRSMKCACHEECLPEFCACRITGRQCWSLCNNHPQLRPTETESTGIVNGKWECMEQR